MDVTIPLWAAIVTGLLGALGGLSGVAAILDSRSHAQSSAVENLQATIDSFRMLNGTLLEEISRLEDRVMSLEDTSEDQVEKIKVLEEKVALWREKFYELCEWVTRQGLEPPKD